MKKIHKTIMIAAPKEKVWNVLVEDELNRLWFAEFSAGSHAITDWIEGHKVIFTDDSNSGIIGKIIEKHPYEMLSIAYDGIYRNGEEDFDSADAQNVKNSYEKYFLNETDGVTTLSIECDMGEQHYEMMSAAWDKALVKIETLSLT